jgi:hypothetical protein
MKKTVVALIVAALMLGGCGQTAVTPVKPTVTVVPVVEKVDGLQMVAVDGGAEVWVEAKNKVSAVNFKVMADGGLTIISFIPNKEVFNSMLSNSGSEKQVDVSMGIVKTTEELPSGKVLLGRVLCRSGSGNLTVKDLKLIGPGADGKPAQLLVNDLGFAITVK